jgi:hypothetical protein
MGAFQRPLTGCVVNVSISESDDSASRGFPAWQVNRVTLQVVAALFGQGASIVFGHDWREDGVMEAVCGYARQMQPPVPVPRDEAEATGQPLLLNLLPWPDDPFLPVRDLERLSSTLRVEPAGLPESLRAFDGEGRHEGPRSRLYGYLRARGLTFLRHRLNEVCHARLCLGGRRGGSAGRFPGVIEGAYLAVRIGRPLYVAGLLGGASQQVVEAIKGGKMSGDFCDPERTPARDLYKNPPVQESPETADDRMAERERVWQAFVKLGVKGIAAANKLSVAQNEELFHTPALDRVMGLVLISLSRVRGHQSSGV